MGSSGKDRYVGQIREAIAKDPISANLVEQLVRHTQTTWYVMSSW
jgi:hypothetical protein